MQYPAAILLAVVLAAPTPLLAAEVKANPLGKVIDLLDTLAVKVKEEGEAEAKAYKEFYEWCDSASQNKNYEIDTANSRKAKLEAAISKSSSDSEVSGSKIEELAGKIASSEADLKSASDIRAKEEADFVANEKELANVVDTLGRAINIVEREMAKNPTAFAQVDGSGASGLLGALTALVDAATFSSADRQRLLALAQAQQGTDAGDEAPGAPAAAAYKSHSTGIVDVLQDLKEKAEEQLSDLRKAEAGTRHSYEMLKQSLEAMSAADTKDLSEEKAAKSASDEAKSNAEGDLARTVAQLADATQALETAHANCMTTAADHEATVKARDEELKVIAEAKQILVDSTSGAVGKTYSLLQLKRDHANLRLETKSDLARAEVVTLVNRLAKQHRSAALAQLASRISAVLRFGGSAGEDPFAKVKGLISELISKLQAEAQSDASEKAYCDEQLAKTEEKKSQLEASIAKLTAKIDQSASKSASLKAEVHELQAQLGALAREQAEMDKIRLESHTAYVTAKAELEQGLEGVRKALGLLRKYYGGAAASSAFLQGGIGDIMRQPLAPEQFEKKSGAGSSIIGILEVVESDFAKNLATEETEEADAATEYEKTTQENKVTKTLKDQDVVYKTQEFQGLDKSTADLTADRGASDEELKAVLEYYAKIKERCIAKPEAYAERKRRREAEIQGLKQAISILESETALVQRSKQSARQHFLGVAHP